MSDGDSQLSLSCVERGWQYSRLGEDAFLFDERSEYLARVVVIWCDWEDADKYLFRARPEECAGVPLEGVFIQTLRSPRVPWTWTLPPIPPLAS